MVETNNNNNSKSGVKLLSSINDFNNIVIFMNFLVTLVILTFSVAFVLAIKSKIDSVLDDLESIQSIVSKVRII